MRRELLESCAFRSLGINARKALDRLLLEHLAHAGQENGRLIVTYKQFEAFGVTSSERSKALEELERAGIIRRKRGYRVGVTRTPSEYTLTTMYTYDGAKPTNDWLRITPDHVRAWKDDAQSKRAARLKSAEGRAPKDVEQR